MSASALAILEILEQDSFKTTLCVNVTDDIRKGLELRSEKVFVIESQEINLVEDLSGEIFDLIISYSDTTTIIQQLAAIQFSEHCEILIISSNLLTYSPNTTRKGLSNPRSRGKVLYEIKKAYSNFLLQAYYPFPDVFFPQMILSGRGLKTLYFRYWSWMTPHGGLFSKILENLLVGWFKTAFFSPHMIVKLRKK